MSDATPDQVAARHYDASPAMQPAEPAEVAEPAELSSDEQAALQLFPSMAKPDAIAPVPRPEGIPTLATNAEVSPHADPVMPYGTHVANDLRQAAEGVGEDTAQAEASAAAWVRTFVHHGVPEPDVQGLSALAPLVANGRPDAATLKSWEGQAMDAVNLEFGGPENGARALSAAKAYIAKHPELRQWLNATGLGSHPKVVATVAKLAHRARSAGRL
jgi:hypothetical protein